MKKVKNKISANQFPLLWRGVGRGILACALILLPFGEVGRGFAQTLKRQCIASTGNSSSLSILPSPIGEGLGVRFQQTIGQSYGTTSFYTNKTRYNPGFQQPVFSVETIKSSINATVFPNPTSNQVTIETNLTLENVIIQIIELSGKPVLNEKINEFKSYTINCADWSNGVYLITLSDSKNNLYSSKLIISK